MSSNCPKVFRISLRALLVLVTLFCLWFAKISIEARRQKEAVEWVLRNGGHVLYDKTMEPQVGLVDVEPKRAWLSRLFGQESMGQVTYVAFPKHHGLTDLSPLEPLTELQYLDFSYNDVKDLRPISGFTELRFLYLERNYVEDISPISNLSKLVRLNVSGNELKDISPVLHHKQLKYLAIFRNHLTNEQIKEIIAALPSTSCGP
jgi:hypothetical protein